MKTQLTHFSTLLFTLSLVYCTQSISGQEEAETKNYHYEAQTNKGSSLTIENKFGDVTVKNWNQDKVVVDVLVTIKMGDKDRAQKYLSYVDIVYSMEGNNIKVITQLDEKFNNPGGFFNMGEGKSLSIDYTVNMPANLDLTLLNKYGNVAINELTGYANISVRYGNLKANKILRDDTKPLSQITLGYSHGSYVEEANWLKLELKYSKLEINKARALVVLSKYSKIKVDEVSSLVCEAKYDEYNIGELVNFVGQAGYTDFRFGQLSRKCNLVLKYGQCNIQSIPASFESVQIESSYADVTVGVDPGATYKIHGEASYADINYPNENARVKRIEENTHLNVDGIIGTASTGSGEISVRTNYGNVSIRKR